MRIFINASLSSLAERRLNKEITKILDDLGIEYYLPQDAIQPGQGVDAAAVLEANLRAIEQCNVVLSVLDKPGLGVVFELGQALAMKKCVILFRSDMQDYLGKIMEGVWAGQSNKARSLEELKAILQRYAGN